MPKFKANKAEGESKPNYYKGNSERSADTVKDGEVAKTDSTASESRYQTTQAVTDVAGAAKTETPKSSFNKKTTDAGGSAVKQEVASKLLLSESDYAGVGASVTQSAGRQGLRTMAYSGDAGSILGNAANTPVVSSPSRSDQRFEKKLDATMKKINYLASEQVLTEYKQPKTLSESADGVQGYYGTPKNTSIRSQKAEGGTPADPLVERSADIITEDMLFYINGQYVRADDGDPSSALYNVEPTKSTVINAQGQRTEVDLTGDDAIVYGNYLPRCLTVVINREANQAPYISMIDYTVEDCSITNASKEVLDTSSTAWITDMNQDEQCRMAIDAAAGDETKPGWNPLGRAVLEPTQTVGFLRRVENDLGANVFTAYKFASKAHAYQLNKTAKDGQRIHTPVLEMLLGNVVGQMSSKDFTDGNYYNGFNTAFCHEAYAIGAASLAIALNEGTNAYQTKADVLTRSKSLRSYFNIANNNMDQFRVNPEFVAALNSEDVFSTIDRGYDPLLPVCLTDKVGLITTLDWSRFGDMTADSTTHKLAYDHEVFTYSYADRNSNYETAVEHPLLAGIAKYLTANATNLYWLLTNDRTHTATGAQTLTIPINHSTTNFSLWDFIVMAAVPYMQKSRINSLRDIIDYENDHGYPFNLKPIKELNPLNAVNYSISSIDEPLVSRQMIPATAIRWEMPEFFWGIGSINTDHTKDQKTPNYVPQVVLPWYFNEMQFNLDDHSDAAAQYGTSGYSSGYDMDPHCGVMSMPIVRNGVRLGYLDDVYGMTEREVRLCLDRMTVPPQGVSSDTTFAVYKYGQANEGIPIVGGTFDISAYLRTPRELGMFMSAPHGLLRVDDTSSTVTNGFAGFSGTNETILGNTSYRLYCWKGVIEIPSAILDSASVKVNRSQAFLQYWDCTPAACMSGIGTSTPIITGKRHRLDVGFLVSMRQLFTNVAADNLTTAENQGKFIPATTGQSATLHGAQTVSTNTEYTVYAFHKGLWGRMQRLPMVISPWDTCDYVVSASSGNGANYDPYDYAYMFGFCGMMASDYNEDIFNRADHVQNQGWLYLTDDFKKDSPVLKNGVQFTM